MQYLLHSSPFVVELSTAGNCRQGLKKSCKKAKGYDFGKYGGLLRDSKLERVTVLGSAFDCCVLLVKDER